MDMKWKHWCETAIPVNMKCFYFLFLDTHVISYHILKLLYRLLIVALFLALGLYTYCQSVLLVQVATEVGSQFGLYITYANFQY